VKGQIYEDDFHLPLAMRWGNTIKAGRVVDDFIKASLGLADLSGSWLRTKAVT